MKFNIALLRNYLPFLEKNFGFHLSDINGELMNVHKRQEEEGTIDKELVNTYTYSKGEHRYFKVIDYVLATNDKVSISVTKDFLKRAKDIISLCQDTAFLKEYDKGITEILVFMAALWNRNENNLADSGELDEIEWDNKIYREIVRPDLLNLYIARNTLKKGRHHSFCSIQLGSSPLLKLENEHCYWFEKMLDSYLDQNLGVESVKEAKRELCTVYGLKAGAPMDKKVASYIWGTYHLLQTLPSMTSKKENSCTRIQSRFIAKYLNIVGLTDIYKTDEEAIRSRLGNYLKKYNTLEELLDIPRYKPHPQS